MLHSSRADLSLAMNKLEESMRELRITKPRPPYNFEARGLGAGFSSSSKVMSPVFVNRSCRRSGPMAVTDVRQPPRFPIAGSLS